MIAISEAIDVWLAIYATRVRPGTARLQRCYLRSFLDWTTQHHLFDLRAIAREYIQQYQMHLRVIEHHTRTGMKKLSASSRCERFGAVKRFFAWAVDTRLLIVDPTASVRRESRSGNPRT